MSPGTIIFLAMMFILAGAAYSKTLNLTMSHQSATMIASGFVIFVIPIGYVIFATASEGNWRVAGTLATIAASSAFLWIVGYYFGKWRNDDPFESALIMTIIGILALASPIAIFVLG